MCKFLPVLLRQFARAFLFTAIAPSISTALYAQDSRTVTEPSFPPTNHRPYACFARAIGVDGKEVFGIILVTYNGFFIPPVEIGTYNVMARFFSFERNYTNATGTGTLTIDPRHDD